MNILTVNLVFSTLVFWVAAKLYVLPRLDELRPQTVLLPILLLHAFRHLGLMFLAPGATYAGLPMQFAYPAALGSAILVMLCQVGLIKNPDFLPWYQSAFSLQHYLDTTTDIRPPTRHTFVVRRTRQATAGR